MQQNEFHHMTPGKYPPRLEAELAAAPFYCFCRLQIQVFHAPLYPTRKPIDQNGYNEHLLTLTCTKKNK